MLSWKIAGFYKTLIHFSGLTKVKCGCCPQHCFIWQRWICIWTCWQASWDGEPWTVLGLRLCQMHLSQTSQVLIWHTDFSRLSGLLRAQNQMCSSDGCMCRVSSQFFISSTFSCPSLDSAQLWLLFILNKDKGQLQKTSLRVSGRIIIDFFSSLVFFFLKQ